jgi:hypothetical protein
MIFILDFCDFGVVISGNLKKRTFKLVNTSFAPITLDIDTKFVSSSGYIVSPDKIQRLPEGESSEINIAFSPREFFFINLNFYHV